MNSLNNRLTNSPIKWVGGKSRLRKTIISMLPRHNCYVEVFGGAGWVLFAKQKSQVEIFNDIDGELINFFRVIQSNPRQFIRSFQWELVSRERFNELLAANVAELTEIQRAHRFYYLIMASWGGEFGNPRFQTSVFDHGHGNRLVGGIRGIRERILPAFERLQDVIIEHLDWRECLARYDRSYRENQVVMYLDPPYPDNSSNYNHNMRDWRDHEEIGRAIRNLQCRFVLTSYDLPETRELYEGFHITPVDFVAGMPVAERRSNNHEIIVTNYDPFFDWDLGTFGL